LARATRLGSEGLRLIDLFRAGTLFQRGKDLVVVLPKTR
jgi:hypothetical protein